MLIFSNTNSNSAIESLKYLEHILRSRAELIICIADNCGIKWKALRKPEVQAVKTKYCLQLVQSW